MKVKIQTVRKTDNEVHVIFSTAIGTGAAIWKAAPPETGEEQEVELEINDEFVYGRNAKGARELYSLSMEKNTINLNAQLVSIEEDGIAVIDIKGTKVMIDLIGCPSNPPAFIHLSFESLNLYPVNL
jgi:hypothetical protein